MPARIEPLAGVIRYWDDDAAQYGDPYQWVASVRWLAKGEVEILGYIKPLTVNIWRAVMRACKDNGIKRILAVRYQEGERVEKWIPVRCRDSAKMICDSLFDFCKSDEEEVN